LHFYVNSHFESHVLAAVKKYTPANGSHFAVAFVEQICAPRSPFPNANK